MVPCSLKLGHGMTLTKRLLLLALISVLPAIVIWTYTEVSLRRARETSV
jgi:Tfp pilus assembly protein PilE